MAEATIAPANASSAEGVMRRNALQAREALRSVLRSSGLTVEAVDQWVRGLTDVLTEARVQQYLKVSESEGVGFD